jgi:hypothetical protein
MLLISVQARAVYGGHLLYPANDAAKHLAAIAGTKTLSQRALAQATLMGATISIQADTATASGMAEHIDTIAARIKEHGQ